MPGLRVDHDSQRRLLQVCELRHDKRLRVIELVRLKPSRVVLSPRRGETGKTCFKPYDVTVRRCLGGNIVRSAAAVGVISIAALLALGARSYFSTRFHSMRH
jgi:hypothetical protein